MKITPTIKISPYYDRKIIAIYNSLLDETGQFPGKHRFENYLNSLRFWLIYNPATGNYRYAVTIIKHEDFNGRFIPYITIDPQPYGAVWNDVLVPHHKRLTINELEKLLTAIRVAEIIET